MHTRYWQYLQECLRSGEFGTVRLGMNREEVRARLGEPDATGGVSRKHRIPSIWKYGEVELHFNDTGNLCLIFWDDEYEQWISFAEKGGEVHLNTP